MESLQSTARLVTFVKRISAAQGHDNTHTSKQLMNQSGVPGFETLARNISIWRPKPINTRISRSLIQSPPLIIFCSGRCATSKNIAKYTEKYKYLYPEAEILLIESSTSAMPKDLDLSTAVEVAKRHIDLHKVVNTKGLVIHVASDGGAYTATRLVRELVRAKLHVPLEAMVLDCSPGKYSTSQSVRAAKLGLPKNIIMRVLGSWAVYAFYGMNVLVKVMLPLPDKATRTRRDLNNPELFAKDSKRLYLYSEADGWIGHEQIGKHADDAEALGYNVRKEVFVKAAHCSLTMEDGRRYWKAVQNVVEGEPEQQEKEEKTSSDEGESELVDEEAGVRTYFIDRGISGDGEEGEDYFGRRQEVVREREPELESIHETNEEGEPSWLNV